MSILLAVFREGSHLARKKWRGVLMSGGDVKTVKVHYRAAKLTNAQEGSPTLQARLAQVMASKLGADAMERLLPMAEDDQHQGCLNYSESKATFFAADIMHLDGRTSLPRWITPKEPKPYAEVVPRDVAEGEASLGEPVYIMVSGNHVAAIERMGFRTTNLARYLNSLLAKAGELETDTEWRLAPKIELEGSQWRGGGVKRVVFKPRAAILGDAPSAVPDGGRRQARAAAAAFEDMVIRGKQVFDALVSFGADEAKLEKLREAMSADLVIKAKMELSVAKARRASTAEVPPEVMEQALGELTADGEVTIVSEDGRSNGKLVQLVHTAEVMESGGLLDWGRTVQALSSALSAWAAKGAIELE